MKFKYLPITDFGGKPRYGGVEFEIQKSKDLEIVDNTNSIWFEFLNQSP